MVSGDIADGDAIIVVFFEIIFIFIVSLFPCFFISSIDFAIIVLSSFSPNCWLGCDSLQYLIVDLSVFFLNIIIELVAFLGLEVVE